MKKTILIVLAFIAFGLTVNAQDTKSEFKFNDRIHTLEGEQVCDTAVEPIAYFDESNYLKLTQALKLTWYFKSEHFLTFPDSVKYYVPVKVKEGPKEVTKLVYVPGERIVIYDFNKNK